jgi:hypothetical protein
MVTPIGHDIPNGNDSIKICTDITFIIVFEQAWDTSESTLKGDQGQ